MSYQSRPRKRKEEEAVDPATSSAPLSPNRLLASYMAYEFLANGTLFGHKFEPVSWSREGELSDESKPQSYFEAANLVWSKAVPVAGVVNPTQLARWVQS